MVFGVSLSTKLMLKYVIAWILGMPTNLSAEGRDVANYVEYTSMFEDCAQVALLPMRNYNRNLADDGFDSTIAAFCDMRGILTYIGRYIWSSTCL